MINCGGYFPMDYLWIECANGGYNEKLRGCCGDRDESDERQ